MQSTPRTTPEQAPGDHNGAGSPISRRTLAKGLAWAAPTVVLASPAPAAAASIQDVVVSKTPCSKAGGGLNNIPFAVTTINGAVIPANTYFEVKYAGGSTTPTWSGEFANNCATQLIVGNDSSGNGGRYGLIKFRLRNPMPAATTWNLNISMDIGALITGQTTSFYLASEIPDQNHNNTNDTASHSMYFGNCGD